jgi:hypothetical protein
MTPHDAHDQVARCLEDLQPLVPDQARAEAVRLRCRARLARSRQRPTRTAPRPGLARRVMAPLVVGALCALYMASLIGHALRLRGVF